MNSPFRSAGATDPDSAVFQASVHAALVNPEIITVPAANAVGVSVTPTITTKEGPASESTLLLYGVSQTIGANTTFLFGSTSSNDIPYNAATGALTLEAGVEYELTAAIYGTSFTNSTGGYGLYAWVDSSTKTKLATGAGAGAVPSTFASNVSLQSTAKAVYRPTVDTNVELRCYEANGAFSAVPDRSWATARETVQQYYDYIFGGTMQLQIRAKSSGIYVYDSGEVSGLSHNVAQSLAAATQFEVRARHKTTRGGASYWLRWSDWRTFTTA